MAEAIIGPLVGKLQALSVSEARALVAVNADIRSLRDKLMWMQAFLREADPRRRVHSDELMSVWLYQTRDAVFDAEDAVDQYFLQIDLSRYPSWTRSMIRFFAGFTTQVTVRHNLSIKIAAINSRLEDIIQNRAKYKMDDGINTSIVTWKPSVGIPSSSINMDYTQPHMVKRYKQIINLLEELRKSTTRPVVISVIGENGVGKTSFVRDVWDRRLAVKNHFTKQAWARFPPNLSATNILQIILQKLTSEEALCPRNEVVEKIKKELTSKHKYLLVLDGEVSSADWKHILANLPAKNAGSRVVRITKAKPEEPPGSHGHVKIKLDHFKQGESIQLFRQASRVEENDAYIYTDKSVMEDFGQDVHRITGGLPLAIVLLSGIVRTKEYPTEWQNVFDHLKTKQSRRLSSIMSLSFDDLPHDLKSCLLYFAAWPENTSIEARKLIYMWMAEGFLRPKEGKRMERVGRMYLKELKARHLVTPVPRGDTDNDDDEQVAVHNNIHEFLQCEAQEASFVEIHSGDDMPTLTTARRLSLQNYRDKYAALANPLPKLRSILSNFHEEEIKEEEEEPNARKPLANFLNCSRPGSNPKDRITSSVQGLLQNSEFLRVINLQGLEIGDELPAEIGNVVHLQYLGITSCSLRKLPSSMGKLTSLQTLDVRDTYVKKLPESFWKIRTLRHVFGYILVLPKRVGKLNHLQTLQSIKPDAKDGWDSRTLAKTIHLQFLEIHCLSAGNADALSKALSKLEHLVTLKLHGDQIPSRLFTSSSLRRLEVMELSGKLDLPSNLKDFRSYLPNLLRLSLQCTEVQKEFIELVAKLPFLRDLTLRTGSYVGEEMVLCADGFDRLKKLTLCGLNGLKKIEIHKTALDDVEILAYSESLKVEIHGNDAIVQKIKDEHEDLYKKITHVPVPKNDQEEE